MDPRPVERRTFLQVAGMLSFPAVAGCVGGGSDDPTDGEPDINESITEETTYTFDLEEGDTIWMEFEDNDQTRFIEYTIVPPEGNTRTLGRNAVDEDWSAEMDGEHQLIVTPDRETSVKIWVG